MRNAFLDLGQNWRSLLIVLRRYRPLEWLQVSFFDVHSHHEETKEARAPSQLTFALLVTLEFRLDFVEAEEDDVRGCAESPGLIALGGTFGGGGPDGSARGERRAVKERSEFGGVVEAMA